ncbi:hypothetical protein [Mariniluteicoccus flavus]
MRRGIVVFAVLLALVVGGAAFVIKVLRYPMVDPPRRTDAVYLLASPGGMRAVERGIDTIPADIPVVLSVTAQLLAMPDYQRACARTDRTVICVHPDPETTQGESRNLGRLAAERGWRSATVVTHTSHISRTRLLMGRCFSGEIRMTAVDTENGKRAWTYAGLYEVGAFVKALATPGC